ncbi:single-stranded-DNA-specific exonuclease RecJ [Aureibaculum sp. 2210JD6-5]|uniref:single-stranded-DNA-specific exonuclease RecJ n=1 Tax=Aureibaculum sp. 2210JD6-5 TaxID=3103957 RepID=UPI002AAC67FC|nr:single-stranded-DNA-specific exonuclease RecJ [Aureibaculum sp. 2210JD6-5]MDY7395652.1 single-stranded-DNA-specific exonuclease RecJ [Aureibaculum sp. 2210JD6-5]
MRWTLKPLPSSEKISQLAKSLDIEANLATLLVQRGIETFEEAKTFFRPDLSGLHDPFLMQDMQKAVSRIENAITNNENILIFGDYDVDGTTAVSLVSSYLKSYYPNVATYIPDRYAEGYGVSLQGIDFADDNNFSLIIALDCGIKAIDKVDYASKKGIDFIICDHHRPGAELPKAVAILDPKRDDCNYPYDELCGCGVGFKLVQALASKRNQTIDDLKPYLDLVATAIAADIVPITGENRTLAYFGLEQINTNPRNGIKAIIHQLKKEILTITDVVFIIAPRINAAGRMKHGNYAVELLTEEDFDNAKTMAAGIEVFNNDRRDLDKLITIEALQQIEDNKETEHFSSVVYQEDWHKGVIGIVASRLTETYYRPTLVFTKSGDKLAASARSVSGFDVYNALEACAEHIEQFGGHKYAAGLTLLEENYHDFKEKFEEVVKDSIPPELLQPEIKIDLELDLSAITPKFYRILQQFAPFGPRNMRPVFMSLNVKDTGYSRKVGADEDHLKLSVESEDGIKFNGIGFNLGKRYDEISNGKSFDIVYTIDENTWNGNTSLQLNVRDIKISVQ